MNAYELLAFVILPVLLAGMGWGVVLFNERYGRRRDSERIAAGE